MRYTWFNPYRISNILIEESMKKSLGYASGTLLDIGCGRKPYYGIFKPVVSSYIGLEHPSTPNRNHKADVLGDGFELPIKSGYVNTVLCNQVLEHVPEPELFLKESFRVLKKGGIIILTVPLVWGLHEEPRDFYRFTIYGLEYLFKKTGFEIIRLEKDSGTMATAGQRLVLFLSHRKSIIARAVYFPLCAILQYMFFKLDRIYKKQGDTLNYTVIARKGSVNLENTA
ncbi:MAG: class I SAM-dependent methyltransferase [Candidatus Aenigmarchaeota archaeon]|nr:class I SAM-dependent methyltransferase [Candidatus Aenigmarchaeota archaeon]